MRYNNDVYRRSLAIPKVFGAGRPRRIQLVSEAGTKFSTNPKSPFTRWFAGAELNTCFNALDRHVGGGRASTPR